MARRISATAASKVHGSIFADLFDADSGKSCSFKGSRRGGILYLHKSVHRFTTTVREQFPHSRLNQRDCQPNSSSFFCKTDVQERLAAVEIESDLSIRRSVPVFGDKNKASFLAELFRKPRSMSLPRNRIRRK